MPKFFVDVKNIKNSKIYLEGEDLRHLTVLRKKIGNLVTVCDKEGTDYECEISEINNETAVLEIIKKTPSMSEPKTYITLFQGLPKSDKMELIIQKSVELGVSEIVPISTKNAVVKLNKDDQKKIDRWQKISESAAKQCGRGIVPRIHPVITFQKAVLYAKNLDENYIAFEKEDANGRKDIFAQSIGKNIGLFIGPEGGFDPIEIEICLENGITPFSLGKRILRTETAGFMAIILLLFVKEGL